MDFLTKNLFNLRAIGDIPRGQKINTRGECLSAEKESTFQWIKRLSDGRSKVFRDINRYVSTVIEISNRIMESRYFTKERAGANETTIIADARGKNDGIRNTNDGIRNTNDSKSHNNNIDEVRQVTVHEIKRAARVGELQDILAGLMEARRGIAGQHETYKDDMDVCALIIDLTTRIDQHSAEIKKFLQHVAEGIDIL